jgi:hypothetical protein
MFDSNYPHSPCVLAAGIVAEIDGAQSFPTTPLTVHEEFPALSPCFASTALLGPAYIPWSDTIPGREVMKHQYCMWTEFNWPRK